MTLALRESSEAEYSTNYGAPIRPGSGVLLLSQRSGAQVFVVDGGATGRGLAFGVARDGVVFLGSFVVVFYFLLRGTPEEAHEEQESEE